MGFFDSITDTSSTTSTATVTQAAAVDALVITDNAPVVDVLSTVTLDPAPTNDLLIIEDTPMMITIDSVPDMVDPMADIVMDTPATQLDQDVSEVLIFDTVDTGETAESIAIAEVTPHLESTSYMIQEPTNTLISVASIVSPDETLARAIAELQASDDHSNMLAQAAHTREVDLLADKANKNTTHEAELESLKAAHLAAVALMDEQIAMARKEVEDIRAASKRTAYLKELLEAQVTV